MGWAAERRLERSSRAFLGRRRERSKGLPPPQPPARTRGGAPGKVEEGRGFLSALRVVAQGKPSRSSGDRGPCPPLGAAQPQPRCERTPSAPPGTVPERSVYPVPSVPAQGVPLRRRHPCRSASPRAGGTARPVPSRRGRRLRLRGASGGAHGAAPTHACPGRPRPLRSPPPGAAARSHTAALSPSRTPARGRPGCSSRLFVRFASFMASPGSGFWPFGAEEGSAAAESPGTGRAAPNGRDRPEPTRRNRGVRRRPRRGPVRRDRGYEGGLGEGRDPRPSHGPHSILSCSQSLVPGGTEVHRRHRQQAVR